MELSDTESYTKKWDFSVWIQNILIFKQQQNNRKCCDVHYVFSVETSTEFSWSKWFSILWINLDHLLFHLVFIKPSNILRHKDLGCSPLYKKVNISMKSTTHINNHNFQHKIKINNTFWEPEFLKLPFLKLPFLLNFSLRRNINSKYYQDH